MSTPESIKAWLKAQNKNRAWLAQECGVSPKTVDGWLSAGRAIPEPSARIIRGLMTGKGPKLNPRLTLEEFNRAQAAATAKGQTLEEWISDLIKASLKIALFGGACWFFLS